MRDFLSAHDVPMNVQVVDGEVIALGPDGLAIALTPQAARLSGQRLIEAASQAEPSATEDSDST
jgi:hypothetical protein